jgi:hypothetical protein
MFRILPASTRLFCEYIYTAIRTMVGRDASLVIVLLLQCLFGWPLIAFPFKPLPATTLPKNQRTHSLPLPFESSSSGPLQAAIDSTIPPSCNDQRIGWMFIICLECAELPIRVNESTTLEVVIAAGKDCAISHREPPS